MERPLFPERAFTTLSWLRIEIVVLSCVCVTSCLVASVLDSPTAPHSDSRSCSATQRGSEDHPTWNHDLVPWSWPPPPSGWRIGDRMRESCLSHSVGRSFCQMGTLSRSAELSRGIRPLNVADFTPLHLSFKSSTDKNFLGHLVIQFKMSQQGEDTKCLQCT